MSSIVYGLRLPSVHSNLCFLRFWKVLYKLQRVNTLELRIYRPRLYRCVDRHLVSLQPRATYMHSTIDVLMSVLNQCEEMLLRCLNV